MPILFLIAPLNFLFTRQILSSKNSLSSGDYAHMLPAIVVLVFFLSFFGISGTPQILNAHPLTDHIQSDRAKGIMVSHIAILVMMCISLIVYAYFQWQVIREYRFDSTPRNLKRKQSLLRWLEFITILRAFIFALFLLVIFLSHVTNVFPLDVMSFSMIMFIHPLMDFIFLVIDPQILVGMSQEQPGKPQEIISTFNTPEKQTILLPAPIDTIPESREIPLTDRIRKYLIDEKSFLLQDFNLKFMARALNVHPLAISKSILQESGLSFPDHISKLKLELLDDLIKSSTEFRQYSMDAMAKEVGFKSKNAFYLSFKKLRGTSPSEYYKAYLKKP
jgi:AraC-like DNA-binding protein